jgi:hypothetical protein
MQETADERKKFRKTSKCKKEKLTAGMKGEEKIEFDGFRIDTLTIFSCSNMSR